MSAVRSALGALLLAACTCAAEPSAPPPSAPPLSSTPAPVVTTPLVPDGTARGVVLVVVDGLDDREDTWTAAPTLARLVRDGSRFRMASAGRWAVPAVGAMLASRPPPHLGIDVERHALSQQVWTLEDILHCSGVRTIMLAANGYLTERSGLGRGWDRVHNVLQEAGDTRAAAMVERLLSIIATERATRFFAYVHLMDTHVPFARVDDGAVGSRAWFASHPRLSTDESAAVDRLYLSRVADVDAALGALLAGLEAQPDLLVVVTSTHAAARDGTDGGETASAGGVVPLVFRGPGAPAQSDETVTAIDLAPTILEAMDVSLPSSFEGRSLGAHHAQIPESERREVGPYETPRELCEALCALSDNPCDADTCTALRTHDEIECDALRGLCPTNPTDTE
jgi:hypothetical protein